MTSLGQCPICGQERWVPTVWFGILPPQPSCACTRRTVSYTGTDTTPQPKRRGVSPQIIEQIEETP